jgi:hypothetical protein
MSGSILAGDLSSMPLADILLLLNNTQKTGSLRCSRPDAAKTLEWDAGEIVFARSSMKEDRLDAYLIERGLITAEQSWRAARAPGEERLGAVMVRMGMITPETLCKAVQGQIAEIVYSLFHWKEGHFEFWERKLPQEKIPLDASVLNLILEGVRRLDEWTRVREMINNEGVILTPVKEVDEKLAVAELSALEQSALDLVDGRRTVGQIAEQVGAESLEVWQALHALLSAGFVRTQMIAFDTADPSAPSAEQSAVEMILDSYGRTLVKIIDRANAEGAIDMGQLRRRLRVARFQRFDLLLDSAIEPDGRLDQRMLLANLAEEPETERLRNLQTALDGLLRFLRMELADKIEIDDLLETVGTL